MRWGGGSGVGRVGWTSCYLGKAVDPLQHMTFKKTGIDAIELIFDVCASFLYAGSELRSGEVGADYERAKGMQESRRLNFVCVTEFWGQEERINNGKERTSEMLHEQCLLWAVRMTADDWPSLLGSYFCRFFFPLCGSWLLLCT